MSELSADGQQLRTAIVTGIERTYVLPERGNDATHTIIHEL
ncbi:hypothetical protein [Salinispora mooreana]|nr:hypothetical protein [Salinispora mooreana]